jgi:hypothetical protein
MLHIVKNGTLIIAESMSMPVSCNVQTEFFCAGWKRFTNVGALDVEKRFHGMGWTCFQKTAPARVNVLGFGCGHTLEKAIRKVVKRSGGSRFNCLEITQAIQKKFMGVWYVHISARARNIQQRLW